MPPWCSALFRKWNGTGRISRYLVVRRYVLPWFPLLSRGWLPVSAGRSFLFLFAQAGFLSGIPSRWHVPSMQRLRIRRTRNILSGRSRYTCRRCYLSRGWGWPQLFPAVGAFRCQWLSLWSGTALASDRWKAGRRKKSRISYGRGLFRQFNRVIRYGEWFHRVPVFVGHTDLYIGCSRSDETHRVFGHPFVHLV